MISRIPLLGLTGATALAVSLAGPVVAADAKVAPLKLTPEEVAEKAARKGCKIKICSAFLLKKPGDDVRCNVVKSWRKAQLDKMVKKARVSWPWGKVKCTTDITLPREQMIQAMDAPKFELKLEKHTVSCVVEREKEPATIKFSFAPKVKFEGGKAKKAALNWGKIEAPTLIKGAMWTATATDNTFGVLQSTLVEDINEFIAKKCPAIKDELK
ncbi:MAG: hypothetical protein ACR2PI_28330 [Hyphomicrobiaceae bacterium]